MSTGLIKSSEALPDGTKILSDVEWFDIEWLKIQGDPLTQEQTDNWLKFKGQYKDFVTPVIYADPMDVVKIIPDEALAELQDLAGEKAKDKKDRGKAYKITSMLGQSQPIEVSDSEFSGYLIWMRDHGDIPAFDQTAMGDIKLKLGVE